VGSDGGVGWLAPAARASVALVQAARAPGRPLAAPKGFRELQRRHLLHLGVKVELGMVGSGRFLVG